MSDSSPADERRPTIRSRVARTVLPGFVRRSYALKFTAALLVVVLLTAGIGGATYFQSQAIVEEDAENTLRSTASVQSEGLGGWIDGMESQTRAIAASDVYGTGNRERIRTHLTDSGQLVGADVAGAHYVDPNASTVVASTEPAFEDRSVVASASAWREPIERATNDSVDVGVATSATYERNGQLLLAFVRPVRYGDGVVVVTADVRRGFERLHDSETVSTTTVVDDEGYEVTAPRQSYRSPLTTGSAFEDARRGEITIRERSSDVVAYASVDGVDWVVVAAAPQAELYQASETVGENVVALVLSTLAVLALVGVVLGRGTVLPLIRLRKRARELEAGRFDVDLSTRREDEIGRLFVAFANMRDALREQIRETEAARDRAERSRNEIARQNERLDQFASTLSHDLRNPLNVADGHRDLLATRIGEDADPDTLREHVDVIGESHDRMQAIVDDVLELAREGASIEDVVEVDLETVARDAWSTVEHGDATLTVAGTRTLQADRDRLRRAFENLFRNSIEHGSTSPDDESDGAPSVAVEVGPTDDGFYVADDGPGIPPGTVEEVFEYGHTTAENGTGFGLAIVEAILAAHGWSIDVDQRYEDGARFVVSGTEERSQ